MDELEVLEQENKVFLIEGQIRQARLEIARKRKQILAHEADVLRGEEKLANEKKHLEDMKANA